MIRYDLAPSEYHRDELGEAPTLSQTCAHDLLTLSPAHAYRYHPRLGGGRREATDEMDRGSLIDALLLGAGKEIAVVQVPDKETGGFKRDWRTNAAKDARDKARAEGKVAILPHQLEEAQIVVGHISGKLLNLGIRLCGKSQVALYWDHKLESGKGSVACRALLDHLLLEDRWIFDLKTIASARPDAIQKAIELSDYHVQAAAYTEAVEAEFPQLAGRLRYGLIFAETEPPYAVTPVELGGDMMAMGASRWEKACGIWHRCLNEDHWPDYANGNAWTTIHASRWALAQHEEEMING